MRLSLLGGENNVVKFEAHDILRDNDEITRSISGTG